LFTFANAPLLAGVIVSLSRAAAAKIPVAAIVGGVPSSSLPQRPVLTGDIGVMAPRPIAAIIVGEYAAARWSFMMSVGEWLETYDAC
jgi:hypothetical protein